MSLPSWGAAQGSRKGIEMSGDEWTVTPEGKRYRHAVVTVTVIVWDDTHDMNLPMVTPQTMINMAVQNMGVAGENAHGANSKVLPVHATWQWGENLPVMVFEDEDA